MTDSSNSKYLIDELQVELTAEQRGQLMEQARTNQSVRDWIGRIDLQQIKRKIKGADIEFEFIGKRVTIKLSADALVSRGDVFRKTIFVPTGLLPVDKPDLSWVQLVTILAETEVVETVTGGLEDYLMGFYVRGGWVETEKQALDLITTTNRAGTYLHPLAITTAGRPYYRLPALQTFLKETGGDFKRPILVELLRELGHEDERTPKIRYWRGPDRAVAREIDDTP